VLSDGGKCLPQEIEEFAGRALVKLQRLTHLVRNGSSSGAVCIKLKQGDADLAEDPIAAFDVGMPSRMLNCWHRNKLNYLGHSSCSSTKLSGRDQESCKRCER